MYKKTYKSGGVNLNYYWIRIFDYKQDKEDYTNPFSETETYIKDHKGILLDEYYLFGNGMTRQQAKNQVTEQRGISRFAKPRNNNEDIYAIVIESDKSYYEWFCCELPENTLCFHCHKPISGKVKDFPKLSSFDANCLYDDVTTKHLKENQYYFCSYDCKRKTRKSLENNDTVEWQVKEDYTTNGGVFGYIYHIYNRKEDKHYIGQTRFMPFFRWQEHVKAGEKGDITDMVFEVVTEVRIKNAEYLNNIEAWWIKKFTDEYGVENVMNINHPKITLQHLVDLYNGQASLL